MRKKILYAAAIMASIVFASFYPAHSIYHQGWIDFNKNGRKDVYEDPAQPVEARVNNLISQMTLEEKTCQLATLYGYGAVLADRQPVPGWKDSVWKDGIANIDEQLTGLRKDTLFAFPYAAHATAIENIQRWFVEETRLGIPVDFTTEGIRGLNHMKATYFPSQLAQACTFNKELVYQIGLTTGREARALGYTNVYSPILDVASDPRWGRIEETYGSDPFLVSQLGKQNILGIQQNRIVSTPKHFAVYSIPVGGRDGNVRVDPHVAPREMWELYLEPFRVAFQEAHARGTMVSYNDYDGEPIISSPYFLTEILRKQFGFEGYVVSDSHAFEDLFAKHFVARDSADAARLALTAGMNVRTDFTNPRQFINAVRRAVRNGSLPMHIIDQRVKEVLKVKFWLGLFDDPFTGDENAADNMVHNSQALALTAQAARESIVLLKNDNLLPLNKDSIGTIAIIGPNGQEHKSLLSRYGPNHTRVVTLFDGIRKALPATTRLLYAEGCRHTDKHFPESDIETFPLDSEETQAIEDAVKVARVADVVILSVGDNLETVGESKSRLSLNLPGRQDDLIRAIAALGKPTILVHTGGRPASFNFAARQVPAILETWYLGETSGDAIADVLFGDYNPGGKLSTPFPKHVGQLPLSFPMKPAADMGYNAGIKGFLYPFGHGLSYTSFAYSGLQVDKKDYASKGLMHLRFKVKNTGTRAGDEVVQLYIHQELNSVITYALKLRGFERIHLRPGEEKEVRMLLTKADLSILNREMKRTTEQGWYRMKVGSSSTDIRLEERVWVQ